MKRSKSQTARILGLMRQVTATEIQLENATTPSETFRAGVRLNIDRNVLKMFMEMSPRAYRIKTAS